MLENESLRRRISVCRNGVPRLVLIAATPDSKQARNALPQLLSYLSSVPDVLVAIDRVLSPLCPPGTPIIRTTADDAKQTCPKYEASEVDLVVCLGGDGLIFQVLHQYFPTRVPPFVPFNMGSLGFLTPFDFESFRQHISAVLHGTNTTVTVRMRLKCVVRRCQSGSICVGNFQRNILNGETVQRMEEEYHALNELVIDRGPAPYLSNLEVLADDCPVTRVQADGLIVATPTGSTAYSLSSGGSMVHPSVPAILFTPICPHSLSFRPVLFPDYVTLQIKVPEDSRGTAWVSFDGRHRMELMRGDRVVVSVSPWTVPTFNKKDTTNDWFASVSRCLKWNERVIQGMRTFDGDKDDEGTEDGRW
ncbi:NAD(+) kinase [Gracilaria domingensis]|nr:NAD(+) kinase [Gracilaria domingensis]